MKILMVFSCLKCKTMFWWEGEKERATFCVHCPECDQHHQFSENNVLEVQKGIVNKRDCTVSKKCGVGAFNKEEV